MKKIFVTAFLIFFAARAAAQDASLNVAGDLMIHPDQIAGFFASAADQIKSSASWSWDSLQFIKPYKTAWTKVQALGPFVVSFDTSNLANQEVGFTFLWSDPQLTANQFEIHDTVTQSQGSVDLVFHLDGACSNLSLHIPSGQWIVKGKMRWDFVAQSFVPNWENFEFQMNTAAAPQVDLGQCQGPAGLIQRLHDAMVAIAKDQSWMKDVLRQGFLDWIQGSLGQLQTQLLTARSVQLNSDLSLAWKPAGVSAISGGLFRIPGNLVLTKAGAKVGADSLARNYDPSILAGVKESGFILPKDTMQRVFNYLYSNGEMQYRIQSTGISSFVSLMSNSFLQFFIWPDLMNFKSSTLFYFDLATQKVPSLGKGYMNDGGGSTYAISAPLVVHQWAPAGKQYLPYLDFTTPLKGDLSASIKGGQLNLSLKTSDLNIDAKYRSEYNSYRSVNNTWIATSMLGSSVQDFLNTTPYSMPVPSWSLGQGMSIELRDVQVWSQTFRLPLQFK